MPVFKWNPLKSKRLKQTRGVLFEDLLDGRWIGLIEHPSRTGQKVMLFLFRDYLWAVPFVEDQGSVFLKTLYPSRKYTKWFKEGRFS